MQIGGESVGSVWVCNVPPHRAQLFPWVVPALALLPYAGVKWDDLILISDLDVHPCQLFV